MSALSLARIKAVLVKEFIQMRRDRMTFAMMIGLPVMQLVMFGFAINSDPRHLPTAFMDRDQTTISRSLAAALENSTYMDITHRPSQQDAAEQLMREGKVNFIIMIPENFSSDLVSGKRPQWLLIADATDPSATSGALHSIDEIIKSGFRHDLSGSLSGLIPPPSLVDSVVHRRYNPSGITHYNVVPGLLGIILAMTMSMMTAVSITRENERGTMENLLAMPTQPLEMMVGKVAPYVFIGYAQTAVVLAAAKLVFDVPFNGSLALLLVVATLYIIVNLIIGFLFSTIARTQMQALQMTFFLLMPQILLSGFMFPFLGMPRWAQLIGEALPATHFMRLIRGIMLKGASAADMVADIWPLLLIMLVTGALALLRYRQTLD